MIRVPMASASMMRSHLSRQRCSHRRELQMLDRDRCLRDWRTRASLVDRHVQSLFFNMAKIAASGRLGLVGAVGIGARDEGMPLVRLLEQGHRAIAVLHLGRLDRKSIRLNSSHYCASRMTSFARNTKTTTT